MKKIFANQITRYSLINAGLLLVIFISLISLINLKNYNLRLSSEIAYITKQIEEQQHYLKILRSEISLVTTPQALEKLYQAHYDQDLHNFLPKIVQIKNVQFLAAIAARQQISLLEITPSAKYTQR